MERTIGLFGLAILGAWLLMPAPLFAQDEPEPEQEEVQAGADDEAADVEEEEGEEPEADSTGRMARRRDRRGKEDPRYLASQLGKLHEVMRKKLDLGSEQEETLDKLFEEHLQMLKTQDEADAKKDAKENEEKILKLRQDLLAAREADDREAVTRLRTQLREVMKARKGRPGGATARFLQKVREELTEEQLPMFREMLKRMELDRYAGPRDHPMSRLMRAVFDPQVGLSTEQRDDIRQMMRDAFTSTARDADTTIQIDEITNDLKLRIFEELTADQRDKIEALLEEDDRDTGPGRHRRMGRGLNNDRRGGERAGRVGDAEDEGKGGK